MVGWFGWLPDLINPIHISSLHEKRGNKKSNNFSTRYGDTLVLLIFLSGGVIVKRFHVLRFAQKLCGHFEV